MQNSSRINPKSRLYYTLLMEEEIRSLPSRFPHAAPTLLLHSCCAPCSSSVVLQLAPHFRTTVFYYNPNIDDTEEYNLRASEQKRILTAYNQTETFVAAVTFVDGIYTPDDFYAIAHGLEDDPEGGERCRRCFALRLTKTAVTAKKNKFDYFCSTLSVSPHKDAVLINTLGAKLSDTTAKWLFNDFKKRNGYLDSIRLSEKYNLYRQNYCGCIYSHREGTQLLKHLQAARGANPPVADY